MTEQQVMVPSLVESINQIVGLTRQENEIVEKAFSTKVIAKGDLWISEGKVCNQVGFVETGKLRNFYIDETGNEITCFFVMPDQFVSSFTSFLTNTPTRENIGALEDSRMRLITKPELESLCEKVPKIEVFRRTIAENLFITLEKRIVMLQSQSAYERYENMLRENPDIILSVPLQYTASFLGITPQHLSRLRKDLLK